MEYTIKKNRLSKVLRIIVHTDGSVVVTIPRRAPNRVAQAFVESKKEWIQNQINLHLLKQKEEEKLGLPKRMTGAERKKDYKNKKEEARKIIVGRLEELNKNYGFTYGSIAIRNQKTRWGSCSRKGDLNFNYKIASLPQKMADYIIFHELCHLKEFNHSRKFWNLVAEAIPDYLEIRKKIRWNGLRFY
ncbi:MAG: M48 family peptidase [Candidatus Pacebacteria bacterium]|nr:M48 family peptidase [Candidatus Paceibacterota bacterium]